jgi:hypothetical protein
MPTHIVIEKHCAGYQRSMPFVLSGPIQFFLVLHTQYTFDIILFPCCMNSAICTPFLSQKTVVISFLTGRQRCLNVFWPFWWICIHCFDYSLVSAFTNESRFHHLLLIWCDWEIHCCLCGIAVESQGWSNSLHFVCNHEHFQNPCCTKLVIA